MAWWIGPSDLLSNAIPEGSLPRLRNHLADPYLRGLSHVPYCEADDRSRKGITTEVSADFELNDSGDNLLLTHVDGRDMAWDYPRQLLERLDRMGDDTLGRIWLLAKILDQDLRPARQIELARGMPVAGRGLPVTEISPADIAP
jgi:hypothetical protein